jgi:2-(1,2-epoxy-1,2-dihydrophenyl)acetyl-CoA isomerase
MSEFVSIGGNEDLHVELDTDGVMLITMDRPERLNALSNGIRYGLLEALEQASTRDDVRAVVLTGAGRAFCAGADAVQRQAAATHERTGTRHERMDPLNVAGQVAMAFRNGDVPVIAAVNGAAAGAGLGLALACDVRFAGESARLGAVFIKRGLSTDYGVSYWLPRVVGQAMAFELQYEGEMIPAARALEIGLVNRIYPDDRLVDEALGFAHRIAAGPPLAYTSMRRLLVQSLDTGMRDFMELEESYQQRMRLSQDSVEGFASFLEKRPPVFRGE